MITRAFLQSMLVALFFIAGIADASAQQNVTINFTNMTPHVNQSLFVRITDRSTSLETGRTIMLITSAAFSITMPAVEPGKSYLVDFFADLNGNSRYDTPPADHAWRFELNNATGNDTINFAHNVGFTDIKWPYTLTINFTGMTPHVGQLLEIKLENSTLEKEITRLKIPAIAAAAFSATLVGLMEPGDYSVEMYADLNGNGLYDAPPVDHAWKMSLDYTGGDVEMEFQHNTTFTDVQWNYLLTARFTTMTPHVGQLFELRVVESDNQEEAGRISMPITFSNFTVYVPGLDLNKDYNIDFYADLNGSGTYNAPPSDHAWRITFRSPGDFVANFNHNTNFTDIQWPGVTSADDKTGIPDKFALDQNFPNPFNPATSISFQLPVKDFVTLKVYDVIGNEVAVLLNEEKNAGTYELSWNATGMPSGVYFYRISAGNFEQTRKMILMK